MKSIILISLAALFITAGSASAKDLLVPSEYKTIQAAIDDANAGDTVIVADGTYTGKGNCDIVLRGKGITVMSENGPEKCIINCQERGFRQQMRCGFILGGAKDSNSIVDGFTITRGWAKQGGAIRCRNCSPTINNCIITNNFASREHGGGRGGGGILCELHSSPIISNCTIIANEAPQGGGGIRCTSWSSPTIINCIISGNRADRGGGIYCDNESSPKITNCTIIGNSASQSGGGLHCSLKSSPTITNCIITGNFAQESGGGLFCRHKSVPEITNCTICNNEAQQSGGGGVLCWDSAPKITNSILWKNLPDEIYLISASPQLTYCDIKGGYEGKGNIDADPLFVMDGPYAITGTWTTEHPEYAKCLKNNRATLTDSSANFTTGQLVGELIYANDEEQQGYWQRRQCIITANTNTSIEVIFMVGGRTSGGDKGKKYRLIDYYLQPGSPCIDAGTAEGTPATDIQGRIRAPEPDIGAYETGF